jgi:type VI secretion system secreted protein VgrG
VTTPAKTLDLGFSIEGVASSLRVVALEGREAISELFAFHVTIALDDEHAHLDDVVGRKATLRMDLGPRARTIHGVVSRVEDDDGGSISVHRVTLSPPAYLLSLRQDCRIFQDRSAPEIIESVLRAAGFAEGDYRLVLHGAYRRREQCAQYRETDWSFLLRLLESEGIFCFFEPREGDRDALVFSDTPFVHPRIAEPSSLPYRRAGGAIAVGEHVHRFRVAEALRPGSVELRGHSFLKPQLRLESAARAGAITIHDAPPAFDSPEAGDKLARIRLEQEDATRRVARGESISTAVRPGHVFGLAESGRDALNRDWLVTAAEHHATVPASGVGSYTNRFTCIPADVPFRAPTQTPRPVVRGVQTAVVVGPPGETIHCDALGRVKVRLHWDREGRFDENSACWVRVSQAWAGQGYGALFTPRVGHQVLVDFVDGDPDRPVVVGSVYDGANLPPASLPQESTTTAIRTSSLPDGGGRSELRFDDRRGEELVYLGAHRDLGIGAGQDKDESIGRNESIQVGGDRTTKVAGNEAHAIGQARAVAVAGAQSVSVGQDETVRIGGASSLVVGGAREVEVGGDHTVAVAGQRTEVIGQRLTLKVGGDKAEKVTGSSRETVEGERALEAARVSLDVKEEMRTTVAGLHEERAGVRRIGAGELVEIVCGEATITAHEDGTVTIAGKNVSVKVAGRIEVEGDKLSVRSQGAVNVSAGGAVKVRGRGITFN